jgi:hypothetical protein
MRELERHAENMLRAPAEGSMAQSFGRENSGCLRRVEGTQREMAWLLLELGGHHNDGPWLKR